MSRGRDTGRPRITTTTDSMWWGRQPGDNRLHAVVACFGGGHA
ncbi:MAG: hypothetical protein ACRDTC_23875 [Pseudonocardiaceae bacterium]